MEEYRKLSSRIADLEANSKSSKDATLYLADLLEKEINKNNKKFIGILIALIILFGSNIGLIFYILNFLKL